MEKRDQRYNPKPLALYKYSRLFSFSSQFILNRFLGKEGRSQKPDGWVTGQIILDNFESNVLQFSIKNLKKIQYLP